MHISYLQPFLISGKQKIADVFHVHPTTVSEWVNEGAPVFLVGKMWQTEYSNLVRWLEEVKPARKTGTWKNNQE